MRNSSTKLSRRCEAAPGLPGKLSVTAAVLCALYGFPFAAQAQQAAPTPQDTTGANELGEITVTANRREQTLEAVPYSLSVISADQLAQANVTDLASLSANVPGLSMYDFGARFAGAVAPIIRGIN
ncbi:MAG TPA: TonB-dependent receptor plug domain-containing protein, partial [Steroidobacteraceae bacterium]|nr:TonB-dependent receptor plug domain-containing protein [Steroidobacteraceae bacterium]